MLELLFVVAILATVSALAIGITPAIVSMMRGEAGALDLDAFLRRHREMAIARRRDIEIRFIAPNQVESAQRAVPDVGVATPGPTVLERLTLANGITYWRPTTLPDTPDLFGNATAIEVGGVRPVMFTSDGSFVNADGDPVNATITLGVREDSATITAVTILGTTAAVRRWRWTVNRWAR